MEPAVLIPLTVVVIVAYLFPWVVASIRGHHNAGAILVINALLGWTLIGWVVALAWSMTAIKKPTQTAD